MDGYASHLLFLRLRGASLLTRALRAAYAPLADPPKFDCPAGKLIKMEPSS